MKARSVLERDYGEKYNGRNRDPSQKKIPEFRERMLPPFSRLNMRFQMLTWLEKNFDSRLWKYETVKCKVAILFLNINKIDYFYILL